MVRRLLLLNGLAVIGAVLYHASGWGFTAMFWWTDRYLPVSVPDFGQMGSLAYYLLRLVEQLVIFSIPAFLFVSGFFIAFAAGRDQKTVGWHLVGTRIKNIVIPYLLWSSFIIIAYVIQGQNYTLAHLLQELIFGKAAPPYYYVPLIIQLYLLAPFLIKGFKSRPWLIVLITAGLQLSIQTLKYLNLLGVEFAAAKPVSILTASWFFPGHIFWFVFGIIIKFNLATIKSWLTRFKWIWLSAFILLIPIGMWEWEAILQHSAQDWLAPQPTILDELYSLMFLLCFLAFDRFPISPSKPINEIGTKSYGIYLIHSPVLEYASRGIYHLAPWILGLQFLYQPILVALGIGIPFLMMKIVERTPARRFYTYLFG